jgi:formiminotetrahydrofolate cyclodeaminase
MRYYAALKVRLDAIRAELQAVIDKDVQQFNEAVAQARIPPVAAATTVGR